MSVQRINLVKLIKLYWLVRKKKILFSKLLVLNQY